MARVTIEDCSEMVENRFALVLLAAARARQLMKGSRPLIEGFNNNAQIIALREIAVGKVHFDQPVKNVLRSSLLKLEHDRQTKYGLAG